MRYKTFFVIFLLLIFLIPIISYANEEEHEEETVDLEQYLTSTSLTYIIIASIIVSFLIIFSIFYKNKTERIKMTLFLAIIIPIILATLYSAGSTIYLNVVSETGGPVHWHADFEIWNCGEKVDLIDSTGLLNRIGSSVFHTHGDDRIHVEGVVVNRENVDLHSFFEVIGGSLANDYLAVLTNKGLVEIRNGDLCNGQPGKLQVFVYKITNPLQTRNWIYTQEKIDDFPDYVLSPYSNVLPGDCIIIEFSEEKNNTENICETYRIAIQKGELSGS